MIQSRDSIDINQVSRIGQVQLHERDQAHPARQYLCVGAVPSKHADGVIHAVRHLIIEGRRNHRQPPQKSFTLGVRRKDRKQPEDIPVYSSSVPSNLSRAKRLMRTDEPKRQQINPREAKGLFRWRKHVISKIDVSKADLEKWISAG